VIFSDLKLSAVNLSCERHFSACHCASAVCLSASLLCHWLL